ncbi:MAG: hypothetical protein DMF89_17440 [Acidobacteria bacterium]|nr:MAG: hypothetical protein DMF89_17440 [Acidobacteriota bacterium]
MRLARTMIATPLGEMLALASDGGLCALEFMKRWRFVCRSAESLALLYEGGRAIQASRTRG